MDEPIEHGRDARIPRLPVDDARAAAEGAGVPTYVADLSLFQVLFHHPALARAVSEFTGYLLLQGRLDARLRELVIMRVGWQTGSVYEWVQHWRMGPGFGAPEADLRAVRDWRNHDGFGPVERAVLAATDEALADGSTSAATLAVCEEQLGDTGAVLELLVVIGAYRMLSTVLQSLDVPLEDGLVAWPPEGVAPG